MFVTLKFLPKFFKAGTHTCKTNRFDPVEQKLTYPLLPLKPSPSVTPHNISTGCLFSYQSLLLGGLGHLHQVTQIQTDLMPAGEQEFVHIPPSPPPPSCSLSPSITPSSSSMGWLFSYQSLLLQVWHSSIKHKYRFDPVEQKLAYSVEESNKVGIWHHVAFSVTHPFQWLV